MDEAMDALATRFIAALETVVNVAEEISRLPPGQRAAIGDRFERESGLMDRLEALDGVLDG